MDLRTKIRSIPDHPKPGILFRDVTTLMSDSGAMAHVVDQFGEAFAGAGATTVAGIEARGFVFGAALAARLDCGFVPIRKAGKLPAATISRRYALEYGEDQLEMHRDAVSAGEKVILIDDLIATGGTAVAAVELLREAGAEVAGVGFVIDLPDLGGRERLESHGAPVVTLVEFEGH